MTETPDKGNTDAAEISRDAWIALGHDAYQALITRGIDSAVAMMNADDVVHIHLSKFVTLDEAADTWVTDRMKRNTPPIPDAGETHGERITEFIPLSEVETLPTDQDVEVYLSSEISERAPTKDRPEPTYGTSSKVSLTYRLSYGAINEYLTELIGDLHERQEFAMQEEITRRKTAKATAAGLPGSGNDPDDMSGVPF